MNLLDEVFFTSDHHFGHANIIKFCNRPYETVEEMDTELIANWNDTVPENGLVYHLGDFTLGDYEDAGKYLDSLNGTIYMLGASWHHDKRWLTHGIHGFYGNVKVTDSSLVFDLDLGGKYPLGIHLYHYPIGEWDRKHHGAIHLHGHSHGNYKGDFQHTGELCFDVGVDSTAYTPVSLRTVLEMAGKTNLAFE